MSLITYQIMRNIIRKDYENDSAMMENKRQARERPLNL